MSDAIHRPLANVARGEDTRRRRGTPRIAIDQLTFDDMERTHVFIDGEKDRSIARK